MQEILDHNPNESHKSNIFSKLAFWCTYFYINIAIFLNYPHEIDINYVVANYTATTGFGLFALAFIFSVISLIKKESNSFYKISSVTINFFLFIFFFIIIAFKENFTHTS